MVENMNHCMPQMDNHIVCLFHQTLFSYLNAHRRISTNRMLGTVEHWILWHDTLYGPLALFPFLVLSNVKGISLMIINCLESYVTHSKKSSNDKKSQGLSTKALLGHVESFVNLEQRWQLHYNS